MAPSSLTCSVPAPWGPGCPGSWSVSYLWDVCPNPSMVEEQLPPSAFWTVSQSWVHASGWGMLAAPSWSNLLLPALCVHCWLLKHQELSSASERKLSKRQMTDLKKIILLPMLLIKLLFMDHCVVYQRCRQRLSIKLFQDLISWPAAGWVADPGQTGCSVSSRRPIRTASGWSLYTTWASDTLASTVGPAPLCSSSASSPFSKNVNPLNDH